MRSLAVDDATLARLLEDDVPCGDLTTHTLGIGERRGRLVFSARHPMTVCGVEEAVRVFDLAGARAESGVHSGQVLVPGDVILRAEGTAASLHRAWKAAQILVEWASGIASAAAAIVAAAGGVPVACTRKNPPGTKALSVKAVRSGGATMHRIGLSETLLVFPEHRVFLEIAPADMVGRLKRHEPEKRVVVEVGTVDEALVWARAGADVLQLEKFSPAEVADCKAQLAAHTGRVLVAVAGGIRVDVVAAYVGAGADILVTSAPYSAPPRDVEVQFFGGRGDAG